MPILIEELHQQAYECVKSTLGKDGKEAKRLATLTIQYLVRFLARKNDKEYLISHQTGMRGQQKIQRIGITHEGWEFLLASVWDSASNNFDMEKIEVERKRGDLKGFSGTMVPEIVKQLIQSRIKH